MLLAVRPRMLLPFTVLIGKQKISFEPTAEVPDEWGQGQVAKKNSIYFVPTDEDPVLNDQYQWTSAGKTLTLDECIKALSTEDFTKVLEFARSLAVLSKPVETLPEVPAEAIIPPDGLPPEAPAELPSKKPKKAREV
jgi:hypothetical protein